MTDDKIMNLLRDALRRADTGPGSGRGAGVVVCDETMLVHSDTEAILAVVRFDALLRSGEFKTLAARVGWDLVSARCELVDGVRRSCGGHDHVDGRWGELRVTFELRPFGPARVRGGQPSPEAGGAPSPGLDALDELSDSAPAGHEACAGDTRDEPSLGSAGQPFDVDAAAELFAGDVSPDADEIAVGIAGRLASAISSAAVRERAPVFVHGPVRRDAAGFSRRDVERSLVRGRGRFRAIETGVYVAEAEAKWSVPDDDGMAFLVVEVRATFVKQDEWSEK